MKTLLLAAISLLIATSAYSQDGATVSGFIIDQSTSQPFAGATVVAVDTDTGETITGIITDETGRFVIAGLPSGNYSIRTSAANYESATTALLVGTLNDIYALGEIALRPDNGSIEEIVAVGVQQTQGATIDQRVFSMADNIVGSTGSMLDALRNLPGVTVDQDGRVLLRGSDQVSVLIDGRYSSLTGFGNQAGLDSIPAANIDRIEIINNPSAAFDAAGMAGVINIIYREDLEQGLNIDGGLTIGSGTLSKNKADLPTELGSFSNNPKITPSLNINSNNSERRLFLQSQFLIQEDIPNNEFTTRFYEDGSTVFSQVPENREQEQYIITGGIERYIDDSRTFTFSAGLDFETHTDVAQVPFIDGATQTRNRFWFWEENEDTGYLNFAATYERLFAEPGHELSMGLQYTRGWEDEAYFLNENSPVRIGTDMTHLDAEENTLPFQIDYIRPLKSGRIESGMRLQRRWIPISYTVNRGIGSVIYDGLGDWSEWKENIYAGYANFIHEKTKYAIEAGVRLEQTDVNYVLPPENIYYSQSDSYDYFEVYPNVRLTYLLSQANSVAIFYNNRVDRPGEPELRIFPKYDDPELLKVGNPYLRPQFTESFEISFEHLWDTGSAIVSAYHRDIKDPFTRVFAIDPTNLNYDIVNRIYQNVGSGTNTGWELILSQDVGSRWEVTGNLNWYQNEIDADVVTLLFPVVRPFIVEYSKDDTWDASINSRRTFGNGMALQLSMSYYGDRNIAQGSQDARSSLDIGFSMPMLEDRGEFVVSVTDLFNDFGIRQNIRGAGFDAIYENYYETQVVSIGMNYTFK